jgi:hypothetical protein
MDQAPLRRQIQIGQRPFDRTRAGGRQHLVHLGLLFGKMHVNRAIACQSHRLRQITRGHRAQ